MVFHRKNIRKNRFLSGLVCFFGGCGGGFGVVVGGSFFERLAAGGNKNGHKMRLGLFLNRCLECCIFFFKMDLKM